MLRGDVDPWAGSLRCFPSAWHSRKGHSSDMKDEEYTLAPVTEERGLNDGWREVRSRRRKKTTTKGAIEETLEFNAVHAINDENITFTIDSGAAV